MMERENCKKCKGTGHGHVDMMRLSGGPLDENGNMRWACEACGGRGTVKKEEKSDGKV